MDIRRRMLMSGGGFPAEPTAYELINTYTASGSFIAPENGYFQIEVFGASGNGGNSDYISNTHGGATYFAGGGGGGGGGYSCSRIKMMAGDTITFVCGGVGNNSSANINSSLETYYSLSVTSGANGSAGTANKGSSTGGAGGTGGVATGGNYANNNGGSGSQGGSGYKYAEGSGSGSRAGGAGGAAGYTGGRVGGEGAYAMPGGSNPGAGASGFVKIYRGNKN